MVTAHACQQCIYSCNLFVAYFCAIYFGEISFCFNFLKFIECILDSNYIGYSSRKWRKISWSKEEDESRLIFYLCYPGMLHLFQKHHICAVIGQRERERVRLTFLWFHVTKILHWRLNLRFYSKPNWYIMSLWHIFSVSYKRFWMWWMCI